jgi:hypothetical protein
LIQIPQERFRLLIEGHFPSPLFAREKEWWADPEELVLGVLLLDTTDSDWSWVVLGRDEIGSFRAIDLAVSLPNAEEARRQLQTKLLEYVGSKQSIFP